jgi:hypothetical protein
VRVGAASISVECRDANEWKVVGTVPVAADGSWPAELPGLPPELAGARAAIVLPESELFYCEFELPSAAERQLSSVLQLQLERAMPLPLEQILYDRQIVARDRERFTVRAAIAHRERVEQLRDAVARWDLVPVCAGAVTEQGTVLFNFLKRRRDPLRWRPSRQDVWLMRAATAGVGVLALVLAIQWIHERYVVTAESTQLHAQATRLSAERAALIEAAKPLLALQTIAATRDAPALLATLSTTMPLDAWFTHIEIEAHADAPGRLQLMGPVTSREAALTALRAVAGVRNPRASSVFNGEIGGRETVEFNADFNASSTKAGKL